MLDQVIKRLLKEEQDFGNRQVVILSQIDKMALARPVLEEAYSCAFDARKTFEVSLAEYRNLLHGYARDSSIPPQLRLIYIRAETPPSAVFRHEMMQAIQHSAAYYAKLVKGVASPEEGLLSDLDNLFTNLYLLLDPPSPPPSRWKGFAKLAGSAVAGSVVTFAAVWYMRRRAAWKVEQKERDQKKKLAQRASKSEEGEFDEPEESEFAESEEGELAEPEEGELAEPEEGELDEPEEGELAEPEEGELAEPEEVEP